MTVVVVVDGSQAGLSRYCRTDSSKVGRGSRIVIQMIQYTLS